MSSNLRKFWTAACMAGMLALPVLAHADQIDFTINVGTDDEAHYHFADKTVKHHSEIWKAAMALQTAKHRLWEARKHTNFGGHAESSIQAINLALDELRQAEEFARAHK